MPRLYKPDPRVKRRIKPDQNIITKAIQAISNGMTVMKASKKFNINYSMLYRHSQAPPGSINPMGGQPTLSKEVEEILVASIITCGEWGYPLDSFDLRMLVKSYLDKKGMVIKKFKNNLPGQDFARSFLNRHKAVLSQRSCQNIKRSRAGVGNDSVNEYFDHLAESVRGVPPSNIVNYDETNLSDDPGRKKIIVKRGTKYPERIMNSSKSATSLMYAAAADGTVLPPYVVYKATNMYISWTEGGPKGARYNRSASGWFDTYCFSDWVTQIAVPYFRRLPGKKLLVGDNLSSHLAPDIIKMCEELNIAFVFLPPNSTHLTQPLDVAFFRPLKMAWRKILTDWKRGPGRKESSIPKDVFPSLLNKMSIAIQLNQSVNVVNGFEKCGIVPLNRDKILSVLPKVANIPVDGQDEEIVNNSVVTLLKEMRYDGSKPRQQRKKIAVIPGKSVLGADFQEDSEDDKDDPMQYVSDFESGDEQQEDSPTEQLEQDEDDNGVVNNRGVYRNGQLLQGVYPVLEKDIKVKDWLLIDDRMHNKPGTSSNKNNFFICQVCNLRDTDGEFKGDFFRLKATKLEYGSIFVRPPIADVSYFFWEQVVGKLMPPQTLRRGNYKFAVDATSW